MTFEQKPRKGKDEKCETKPKEGNLYCVLTRQPKRGKIEVNTLLKKDFYPVQINEAGPQQDCALQETQFA